MIEKQMIRLMLNKKFYTQYKGMLSPTVFSGDISSLYDTIQKAHEKYDEDIKDMNRSEWNQRDQSIMDAIELILRKELDDRKTDD